jgi:TPP-dependent pyruvate/acetoin dehydrogenase alpha subunit
MKNQELIERLYKSMLLIRQFELRLAEVYHTDVIKSPVHLSVGQEAIAVGVCDVLKADDVISNTYRCHATYIAKGGDLNEMMAELYGKTTGCAGGKAGSMHLVDVKRGIMGASAVVGSTVPVAAGHAWSFQQDAKKTGQQRVVAAMFGDGCTEEGTFYETLNFASLKKLPMIFICENNRLAIHTPVERRWATERLCERVETFGIKTHKIDDSDIFTIRDIMTEAIADARAGKGPTFIECATYRWLEHVGPRDDHDQEYRNGEIYQQWQTNDQIKRLADMLDDSTLTRIQQEITQAIRQSEDFADKSPYPAAEELYTHVYAN